MKNLTLEQLAEKLRGRIWEKGDKKRIYLDRGHNTKKMKTTTYVYEREPGNFIVSCYIDCPSQPYEWINSQKDSITEDVESEIQWATQSEVFAVKTTLTDEYLSISGLCERELSERFLYESGAFRWLYEEGNIHEDMDDIKELTKGMVGEERSKKLTELLSKYSLVIEKIKND